MTYSSIGNIVTYFQFNGSVQKKRTFYSGIMLKEVFKAVHVINIWRFS